MKLKRKLIISGILILLLLPCLFLFPGQAGFIPFYDRFVYYPIQSLRGILFNWLPFSLGDVLYVLGSVWTLLTVVRWVRYISKFKERKWHLAASVVRCVNIVLVVYLIFFLGWGANYNKEPLRKAWHMDTAPRKHIDTAALVAFNAFLLDRVNAYAPAYQTLQLSEVNKRAQAHYGLYTDTKVRHGLNIKPALFSYFMDYVAIDGYYNPFTGEGQVDAELPAFMRPFVLCHEMAHQAGIAAEGDANLMAYAVCTAGTDSTFRYSGYLNIWLYANNKLFYFDSVKSKEFKSRLNTLTRAHLDALDEISKKYQNEVARYSGQLYDTYLHMQRQKDGIRSYGSVTSSAWQLEQQRKNGMMGIIHIP